MPLIIDCDPGNGIPGANVDDALALCLAWSSPQLDLASVWTVFGNVSAAEGAQAAHRLAQAFGVSTPILTGCDVPLDTYVSRGAWRDKMETPRRAPDVARLWQGEEYPAQGESAQQDASDPCESVQEVAARLAHDVMSHVHGGPVTIAALGPLTDIGALIRFEPEAARHVAEIRMMGGCQGYGDLVDTNFAIDPLAASIVFASGIDLTVVPLDVTRTTQLSRERWEQVRQRAGDLPEQRERAEAIDAWLSPWIEYSTRTRPVDGMWVHDMVVIAQMLCPEVVEEEAGRFMLARDPRGKLLEACDGGSGEGTRGDEEFLAKPRQVNMVTAVDNDRLLTLWTNVVLGV